MAVSFSWYTTHLASDGLDQGLILPDFPVPDYGKVDYGMLSSEDDVALPVEIHKQDLIIMTQACDLQNSKIENVTLCRVYPLNEYLIESGKSSRECKELIGQLNSNRVTNMILLERPDNHPYGFSFDDFLIVKFDESVNFPLNLVQQRLNNEEGEMLKLLPPYRESLSQDYGIFFMRVGNPVDRKTARFDHYEAFIG